MKIRDDRGQLVQVLEEHTFVVSLWPLDQDRDLTEDIERKSSRRGVRIEVGFFVGVGIIQVGIGLGLLLLRNDMGWVASIIIALGGATLWYAWTHPERMRRQVQRLRVERTRVWDRGTSCPGCLYDLRTIRRDPDGCTVCPECGGAWRIQDPES